MATASDLDLTQAEHKYLQKLSTSKQLETILKKFEYSVSLSAVNCTSDFELAQIRGAVQGIQHIRKEILKKKPKKMIDPLSGEQKNLQ